MENKLILNGNEYDLIKTLPSVGGSGSFIQTTVTGLTENKTYEFVVVSKNSLGRSISQPILVNTISSLNPNVLKPISINYTFNAVPISSNGIRVLWEDIFTEELHYEIYVSTDNQSFDYVASIPENSLSYDIQNLLVGNCYYVQINSFIGTGSDIGQLFFTSFTGPVLIAEIPKPPIKFSYEDLVADGLTLVWDYEDELFKFIEIFYSNNGSNYSLIYNSLEEPDVIYNKSFSSLNSNEPWYFKIRTRNSNGSSDFAGPVIIEPPPNKPSPPEGLTGYPGISAFIQLNWTSGATNETGFNLFRSIDSSTYTQIANISLDLNSYVDINLNNNTHYYYKINSYNSGGTSSFSNIVGITSSAPPSGIPASPTGLSASRFYNRINISWNDQATNEYGYKIFVKQE